MQASLVVLSDVINHVVLRVSKRSARSAQVRPSAGLGAFCFRHVSGIKSREIWPRIDVNNVVPAWKWQLLAHAHTDFLLEALPFLSPPFCLSFRRRFCVINLSSARANVSNACVVCYFVLVNRITTAAI